MYDIEMHEAPEEFSRCWQAAGQHLQTQAQGAALSWLKANLTPPFLEHLSFRLGNQLFFVRIEDVEGQIEVPGNLNCLLSIADGCKGYACLMPLGRLGGGWVPAESGWGLLDARTRAPIDPPTLVTNEDIEMTDWETHDFAVQVVRDYIDEKLAYQLMSSQGNPEVDPSIWFIGDHGPEWVVVRAVRYPDREAALPANIQGIAESCARLSRTGHFASVAFANSEDGFDQSGDAPPEPLWRGHGMYVRFVGLGPVSVQ